MQSSASIKNDGETQKDGSYTAQVVNDSIQAEKEAMLDDGGRTCTGVLASRPTSRYLLCEE
jgi:hypothetical protein